MVALIVFGLMNYHHTIIHSKMIKYNTQKQVDKHKEDSCKIVEYERLRREIEQEDFWQFWQRQQLLFLWEDVPERY